MFDWMARFESLGANCEFAFVLHRCGVGEGTLFRFAESFSMRPVARAIRQDFAGIYKFENLVPFNADMVRDVGSEVSWHSQMKSRKIDPDGGDVSSSFGFAAEPAERLPLWNDEARKMGHLVAKTRASLAEGNRIFVYRLSYYDHLDQQDVDDLFEAVNLRAPNTLLVVEACGDAPQAGTVTTLRPRLLHGFVDRFAPGDHADDISFQSWVYVCRAAYDTLGADASGEQAA